MGNTFMPSYLLLVMFMITVRLQIVSGHEICSGYEKLKEELGKVQTLLQTRSCTESPGAVLAELLRQQAAVTAKLHTMEMELQASKTAEGRMAFSPAAMQPATTGAGSSFVRWGRKACPSNTTLIYTGVSGGKQYNQRGSGTNRLCLPTTPQFDNTPKPQRYGLLYGGEYGYMEGGHVNQDVPCSVCLAPQSTTIMVPATLTCPPGWTPQYTGHLATQPHDDYATDYVCLDGSPENNAGGSKDENGVLFYLVMTVCGSLPCPPYVNDKVVTCVVCSK